MDNRFLRVVIVGFGVFSLLMTCNNVIGADPPYEGETIRFMVGYPPGGGYDTYTRTIARHIAKYIPGKPTVVVSNMPGAGSLIAANYLYRKVKPDGNTIGVWDSGKILSQALEDRKVRFDARKFGWIGAPVKGSPTCAIMGFTGMKTLDDVLNSKKPVKMAATRAGSTTYDLPAILNKTVGANFDIIAGYSGGGKLNLSMQQRETDGICLGWESMRATRRNMLDAKGDDELIPFVILDRWEDPEVKDLPLLRDVVAAKSGEKGVALFDAWAIQMGFQRPLSLPPGTPKERIDILRKAFAQTMKDPEFLAEAERARLKISPTSGEKIEAYVDEVLAIRPDVKEELQAIIVKRQKQKQS